jgi:hypothetical protein
VTYLFSASFRAWAVEGLSLGKSVYFYSLNFVHTSLVINERENSSWRAFDYNVPDSLHESLPIYFNHPHIDWLGMLRKINFRHCIIDSFMEDAIRVSIS